MSQTLDLATARSITRIAVAGPENPAEYALTDGITGGVWLGDALGPGTSTVMIMQRSASSDVNSRFTEAMASRGLKLGDELHRAIAGALIQLGYEVVPLDVGRASPSELIADYRRLNVDADAVLDVAIQHSTYERRAWGKVGPSLTVTLRMVDLRSGRQAFLRTYRYDLAAATVGYTILRPPERFGFEEPAQVLASPDLAAEGFRAVIPMIVADLRTEFAKAR